MKMCKNDCVACCDFCIYATHEIFEVDGNPIKGGPIGCILHTDEEHQHIALMCGACKDFHCFRADEE